MTTAAIRCMGMKWATHQGVRRKRPHSVDARGQLEEMLFAVHQMCIESSLFNVKVVEMNAQRACHRYDTF